MAKSVTIKSIAQDLGISHMTVSRALSKHPNVSNKTREKIIKRAEELGYVKSAAATAMRGDSTKIVGLLLPNIVNEFYALFANEMALTCEEHSYNLIIHLTNDDSLLEHKAIQRLREVQAMSVVMVPTPENSHLNSTHLQDMKVIQLIRQQPMQVPFASVGVADSDAIIKAVAHLAEKGHKRIVYIGADEVLSTGRSRLKAFKQGLAEAGLEIRPELYFTDTPSFDMGSHYAHKIFERGDAGAIISGGVEISNGILNAFMQQHVRLDIDCDFIGYGDPSFYAWVNGGISTVHVPVKRLAHKVVDILHDETNSSHNDKPYLFDAHFQNRGPLTK
ncbi:LacI family DNA-binding transcriptional regulator [Cocleimonas flava]|uniref:LacI family transcriptional regulator n=1 Tax=Cocleimonas flava TaxID=634765 RepID=A0A4V2P7T0_9GAMM|nr:LacI family DNA-binding transcriptional regulator [Cocleimonas flava]TCJ83035.1 LacI family transcriptional regulator [Cocleimonas flava]